MYYFKLLFRPIALVAVMFCGNLFMSCTDNDAKEDIPDFQITDEGNEYTLKSMTKKGDSDMAIPNSQGEVKIAKSGDNFKVSLKDIAAAGTKILGTDEKLSFDFEASLKDIKNKESYEIDFDKKENIDKDVTFSYTMKVTDAVKSAFGLPNNDIELYNDAKKARLTFSVEPISDAKKVTYGGKKYVGFVTETKLEVGIKLVSSYKITLTNDELVASVKNEIIKTALTAIMNYNSSNTAAELAKKTQLIGVLDAKKAELAGGTIGETLEAVLKFETKK